MKINSQPSLYRPTGKARVAAATVFCFSLVFLGCQKEEIKGTVLAQVGSSTLTLEELRESFPADLEEIIRREQYLDFIKRWMDDEAVYQQAIKAKLETDPVVGRKLEKLRRKFLIEEYLSRENGSEAFEPDEMAMKQYYEMHKEDFRRKMQEVKFVHIRVETAKEAADLRNKALRGDFLSVGAAVSKDPLPEAYSFITFRKQTEFPPCLSHEIASSAIGSVTLPIACPDGFYLVKVLERQDAGSLISFAEAKDEISGILVLERKDKLLENRIAKLKEGLAVSYNLDQIPGLSDSPKVPETGTGASAEPATPEAAAPGPASSGAATSAPGVDPNLPREPDAISRPAAAPVPAKPPYPPRKRNAKPVRASDSTESRAVNGFPGPTALKNLRTPVHSPAAEGNNNEQSQIRNL